MVRKNLKKFLFFYFKSEKMFILSYDRYRFYATIC